MSDKNEMTLRRLRQMMADQSVGKLYAKVLSANDNSKNQPYFGSDFAVLNLLPAGHPKPGSIGGHGVSIFKAPLSFYWMSEHGTLSQAPGAQLILYPQYPEVRFSGYLRGCEDAPLSLMGQTRLPDRILFLGVREDGSIIGFATAPASPLAREFRHLSDLNRFGVFLEVPLAPTLTASANRLRLLKELCQIAQRGWIDSRKLRSDRSSEPCSAPNCGGFTLEAELGIVPNGYAEPDFLGWEVKQHAVGDFGRLRNGPITLMTPEPTGGIYTSEGVLRFVERFGYWDKLGRPDRLNFGGIHRVKKLCPATGLTLTLLGYDADRSMITDSAGGVSLVDASGREAATWHYSELMHHWNRKHALAVYVPSLVRDNPHRQYKYASSVRLGIGTDFLKFLGALASGAVYYDPGIKVENYSSSPKIKRRSQFRIKSDDINRLYVSLETVGVCL